MSFTKSLNKELRAAINRANAEKSTGPRTPEGKQRSRMNAFKHNLTGQSLILQEDELESYQRLSKTFLSDLQPKDELERQMVQKIIDTNFRLNRIASIENNMFNFGLIENETQTVHDDRIEVMIAQTRSWMNRSSSFEVLGRYESRLTRQLLLFTRELERLQKDRRDRERIEKENLAKEKKQDDFDLASFGTTAPELVMSANSSTVSPCLPPQDIAPELPQAPPEAQIANTEAPDTALHA